MIKADIAENIYRKVGFPKREVAKVVECVFDTMKETLQHEDKIMISGFGNFAAKNKRTRKGRNPQTGSAMEIRSRRVLTFKPSPLLKAGLNRPKTSTDSGNRNLIKS